MHMRVLTQDAWQTRDMFICNGLSSVQYSMQCSLYQLAATTPTYSYELGPDPCSAEAHPPRVYS